MEKVKTRIASIEYCRIIAAVFVVFLHCPFPDKLGIAVSSLARFAVPFFFMVSGYFSWQADAGRIGKRLLGTLKLDLTATALYAAWGCLQHYLFGAGDGLEWILRHIASSSELSLWLLGNVNPFAGHLWYLSALVWCYIFLYLYVRWQGKDLNYRPLYIIGVCFFGIHMALGPLASAFGTVIPFQTYRNALFFGLPMFALGMFLREYQDRILERFCLTKGKLLLLVAAGAALSVLQGFGTGLAEMPVGTLVEVIALMLLLVSCPGGEGGKGARLVSGLSGLSTYIYVTHLIWNEVYQFWTFKNAALTLFGEKEPCFYPVVIAVVSLATGILWMGFRSVCGRFLHKK